MKNMLKNIKENGSLHVVSASVFARFFSFLLTLYVTRVSQPEEYGYVIYAIQIVAFLIPFAGFGANQGFLRFAGLDSNLNNKKKLFNYSFNWGILISLILSLAIVGFAPLASTNVIESRMYLYVISFQVPALYVLEMCKAYFRISHQNKRFALSEFLYAFGLLLFGLLSTNMFGLIGFASSLVLWPFTFSLLLILYFKVPVNLNFKFVELTEFKAFWKYSLYASAGYMASQLLFVIDTLLIGNIVKDAEAIAGYKVASIIPFTLLVLPAALLTSNFVSITENSNNKKWLKEYLFNYWKISLLALVVVILPLYLSSHYVLLFFGEPYVKFEKVYRILLFGVAGAFLFRIPIGNMLSALGKANWNAFISWSVLILNIVLNYFMIIHYGVEGAAWATTFLFWLSGFVGFLMLLTYLSTLKSKTE